MSEILFEVNGHEVEESILTSNDSFKYHCVNNDCHLEVKCIEKTIGKNIFANELKSVAKDIDCPADKGEVEKASEKVGIKDAVREMLID